MKTLIATLLIATSVLSFGAKASGKESVTNLIEAAEAYTSNSKANYVGQGYFMGMVQFYGDSVYNCAPEGMTYRVINQKVARIIVFDSGVLSMNSPFDVMDYAFKKAFPCTKA